MPSYPIIRVDQKDLMRTVDPRCFVEVVAFTTDKFAPDVTYVILDKRDVVIRRWKRTGSCLRCGVLDSIDEIEILDPKTGDLIRTEPVMPQGKMVLQGKRLGEIDALLDANYDTRLDVPRTPEYDADGRQMAASRGLPYICGYRFVEMRV